MTDKQKFEGLKNKLVKENEKKYGQELQERYREAVVKHSHEQFKNLTKEQYNGMNQLSYEILDLLEKAIDSNESIK